MSSLESKINSATALALDAIINKAGINTPSFVGSATFNPIVNSINDSLTCNMNANFVRDVNIGSNIFVSGNANFSKDVNLGGNIYITGKAYFNSGITVYSFATSLTSLDVVGEAVFNNDATIMSNLYVNNDIYFKDISSTGLTTLQNTLNNKADKTWADQRFNIIDQIGRAHV